jgi:hypothetical protein
LSQTVISLLPQDREQIQADGCGRAALAGVFKLRTNLGQRSDGFGEVAQVVLNLSLGPADFEEVQGVSGESLPQAVFQQELAGLPMLAAGREYGYDVDLPRREGPMITIRIDQCKAFLEPLNGLPGSAGLELVDTP